MKQSVKLASMLGLVASTLAGTSYAQESDAEAKIASAMSAAPSVVAASATVMDYDDTVLREGSNGWTCLPDFPGTPTPDPACVDAQWMAFFEAWMSGDTSFEATEVGVGYMLQGGAVASMTDPLQQEPAEGEEWKVAGPHLMILTPNLADVENMPRDPEAGVPWVMWEGTPFVHVMVPMDN